MKKLLTLLLAVAASIGTMFAESGWCGDNLTWELTDGVLTISGTGAMTDYSSSSSSRAQWYSNRSSIKSVVIEDGVTNIGDYAFYDCYGLNSVTIPYSVTSIGRAAFIVCTGLTSVTIPGSVTSIGSSAFYGCKGLTSITIPNSVTSIGEGAFYECTGLTSPVYNTHVFAYMPTSYSGAYTIPDGIESIAGGAFYECTDLTSVTIPNSVTNIGRSAFYSCSGLTSVTIPNSVTSIGENAFQYCTGLTSVVWNAKNCSNSGNFGSQVTSFTFGDEVEVIPASICAGMTNLTSITIPSSVTSIGESAFYSCSSLTSVTIPNSVTSIRDYTFYNCSSLTSVTIPNSVTNIGRSAFYSCSGLTSVTIPNSVTSIGDNAFRGCTGLTSVTIGNSVTSIGDNAFRDCTGLTSVTIPNSVTSIGVAAFYMCTGLTSVTIEAETPPTLDKSVFTSTNNCPIYVPCGTLDAYKTAWSAYASRIKYRPAIDFITTYAENGYVYISAYNNTNATICDGELFMFTLTPIPNNGYHFAQWSDGNTDNPRTIELTQDTTFTAEFAKNSYAISTISANPEWGTTAGDKSALYLDEVEISAIPNYGYHFVQWNDNNTSNPRSFILTQDTAFTATFAKNVYSITKNAEHGSISGNSSAEYLDFVTLTVTPDYGYHFTQWSDGLKDNPRIAQITQDTTFTAEFAYDRVGTCGKDLALVWSYDPTNKVLTIGNAGSFTENMQYGVEAPNEMEELVIGNSVTAIGSNAFAGIETLKKVSIGESVKTIGEQAFYNCVNLETIFNYRPTPTNTYSNAFDGVDKFACSLYVLPSSIDMYKAAAVWRDFYYTYAIGAEEATVTTNDVTVEPQDNAATVTWPTNDNAATYTIQITKDGVVFCTLIFNANGQLTGIAFAPSRDGQAHTPEAIMTANGMQFTVTGLDSGTHYALTLQAIDSQETVLASYSSEFTTTGHNAPQGLDEISSSLQGGDRGRLIYHDGQIFILRGDKTYTLTGQEVK